MSIIRVFITFFFVLFASSAFSATETFYLCNGGDGTAPKSGSCATAWDDSVIFGGSGNWSAVDADDGKLGPNDDLVVLDDGGTFTSRILFYTAGLSGKPITIKAGSGETPVFDTGAGVPGCTITKDYVTLESITFDSCGSYSIQIIGPTDYVNIQSCTISNCGSTGILIDADDDQDITNITITETDIYNSASDGITALYGTAAAITGTLTNLTITLCNIYSNSGDGIDVNGIDLANEKFTGGSISGCTIYDNNGFGINAEAEELTISNCSVYSNAKGGGSENNISVGKGDIVVQNNTTYGAGGTGSGIGAYVDGADNEIIFSKNYSYNNSGAGIIVHGDVTTGSVIARGNFLYENGTSNITSSIPISLFNNTSIGAVQYGYNISEDSVMTNNIGDSNVLGDLYVLVGYTVTGLNNMFTDAGIKGLGTYSDAGSTTYWSAVPFLSPNGKPKHISPAIEAGTGTNGYGRPCTIGAYQVYFTTEYPYYGSPPLWSSKNDCTLP